MQSLGLDVSMPPFLNRRRQFSAEESNRSRCITKVRWIVEAVNRRIKEFKYFANTVQNSSLMYLQADLSNVCALINRYRPSITALNPQDVEIGKEMRILAAKKNRLETVKSQNRLIWLAWMSPFISAVESKQFVTPTVSMGNDWSYRFSRWISNYLRRRDWWHNVGYDTDTKHISVETHFCFRRLSTETCSALCWRKSRYIRPDSSRHLHHPTLPVVPEHYPNSDSLSTPWSNNLPSDDPFLWRRNSRMVVRLLHRKSIPWLL